MSDSEPLAYTRHDLMAYLPTGWGLAQPAEEGVWNPKKRTWTLLVHDGAEVDWPLVVKAAEAEKHGPREALRLAMDRVYREGLG